MPQTLTTKRADPEEPLYELWDAAERIGKCWIEIFESDHKGAAEALLEWSYNAGYHLVTRCEKRDGQPAFYVSTVETKLGGKIMVYH